MEPDFFRILKDPQFVKCWYPCSGDDFEATELWNDIVENHALPNLFILTDVELASLWQEFNTEERLWLNGYELIAKIPTDPKFKSENLIDWRFDKVNWDKVSNEQFIAIIQNGAFAEYLNGLEETDWIDFIDLGIVSVSEFAENFRKMSPYLKAKMLEIIETYPEKTLASLYKNSDRYIIFIDCENNEFLEFCKKEEITIEASIVIRHEADEFFSRELFQVFKTLKTTSLIGYLNHFTVTQRNFILNHQISSTIKHISHSNSLNHNRPDELIHSKWVF